MGKGSTAPSDSFGFHAPTRLLFGPGQLGHLHEQAMPGKRAMLVVSNGKSMRANGYLDRTLERLRLAGVDTVLFDKVAANPTKQVVEEGASFAREHGAEFIVALGGGSVMGAAKVMALLAPLPPDGLWDYSTGSTGRHLPLQRPEMPWVAITTTAGTGSEVDCGGVISKLDTHEKIGIFPQQLREDRRGRPGAHAERASQVHGVPGVRRAVPQHGGFICNRESPFGQMVQLEAMRNIGAWLPVAVRDGSSLEALGELQVACGVDGMRMSDYGSAGTREGELLLARAARETMDRLFAADPAPTTDEDIAGICLKSYRQAWAKRQRPIAISHRPATQPSAGGRPVGRLAAGRKSPSRRYHRRRRCRLKGAIWSEKNSDPC